MKKIVERLTIVFFVLLVIISPIIAAYKPTDRYVYHYVSPGDTLSAVALKYLGNAGLFFKIAELNGLANPDLIIAGRYIRVELNPSVAVRPAPAPTPVEAIPPVIESKPLAGKWHGPRWGLLYGGGGGSLQAGTDFKLGPVVFNASGGLGLGKNYYMGNLQLSKEFNLPGEMRLGLSGVYAYYSKFIINVPWSDQVLNQGNNFGLGAYLAKDLGADGELRGGYSLLLGPSFSVARYF